MENRVAGSTVRKVRQAAELTQKQAARLAGVGVSQWEHIEAGRRWIRYRTWRVFQERLQERERIARQEARIRRLEKAVAALAEGGRDE